MNSNLTNAREHFILGMSQISNFWGFPKAMGAIYGAIYLSPTPISLDELVQQAGVTKGAVSTNVRHLERLGMVHKHAKIGERKDYYTAETDFWQIIRGVLQERQKSEFDRALSSVDESLEMIPEDKDNLSTFYIERMTAMKSFFKTLDSFVAAILALENLVSLSSLRKLVEKAGKEKQS